MLALIKNTFLKKIFLQCFSLSSMLWKTLFKQGSFFCVCLWISTVCPHTYDTSSGHAHIQHLPVRALRSPLVCTICSSGQIQQKKRKRKIQSWTKKKKKKNHPNASSLILPQSHHHMTYCNWILQVGLVWEKIFALSIHTYNNTY